MAHADFVVDKLTAALERSGPGPLITVPKVTITTALDAAGRLTLSTPASDPRNALIVPNALNYVMAVIGGETSDISRVGIIKERQIAGVDRQLRGPNLLDELTYTNVGKLALENTPGSGLPMPAADLLTAVLDGTGWTATGTPSRDVYHRFGDEKTLAALGKLAELLGDHFRLSRTVARQIEWLASGADGYVPAVSGLVAKETVDSSPDACLIADGSLQLVEDGQERITRIYPRGAGNADAQLYINMTTLGTGNPGTGVDGDYVYGDYTLHIDADEPWKSYIKHTVNDAAGSIGDVEEIRDVAAISDTVTDDASAANELVERAIVRLRRRLVDQRSFRFQLVDPDLSRLIEGDSIRLIARAYADGYGYVDVDEDVLILGLSIVVSGDGVMVDVQATAIEVDRWPSGGQSPVQLTGAALQHIVGSISQLKETAAHVQPAVRSQTSQTVTPTADGVFNSLVVNGSIRVKRTPVADTNYTILLTDYLIAMTTLTAPRTLTLPTVASAGTGRVYVVKDESGAAGSFAITIDGAGAELVDGAANVTITTNRGSVRLYCSGSAWFTW